MNKPLLADRTFARRRADVRASTSDDLPALLATAREAADAKALDAEALGRAGNALHSWRESNGSEPVANAVLAAALVACEPRDAGLDTKKNADAIRAAVRAACDLAALVHEAAK